MDGNLIESLSQLGTFIKVLREQKNLTQIQLAEKAGTNRSAVAHLEQGLRLPDLNTLRNICEVVGLSETYWAHFSSQLAPLCAEFEQLLKELTGEEVSFRFLDKASRRMAETAVSKLFNEELSADQSFDLLNSILVYFGVRPLSRPFFNKYFDGGMHDIESIKDAIKNFQTHAIRLYSSFSEALQVFNTSDDIEKLLLPIKETPIEPFTKRTDWALIEEIPDDHLTQLGYISASSGTKEAQLRKDLSNFLNKMADSLRKGKDEIKELDESSKSHYDSLIRRFCPTIQHGLFSSYFTKDYGELRREAEQVLPKSKSEMAEIQQTKDKALANLANYVACDHLDVYVATSMRSQSDYISVNRFCKELFQTTPIRELKLRYFNPTQAWIEDRVAKGVVEALMLKRARVTIYMAQNRDTFGKDSEASVALGQGKPVVVYVPKLVAGDVDSDKLGRLDSKQLAEFARKHDISVPDDLSEYEPETALHRVIYNGLSKLEIDVINKVAAENWADFDLYAEATRIKDNSTRDKYREWLDALRKGKKAKLSPQAQLEVIGILTAVAIHFERRSKIFKDTHPLALQVILSSGVLNGILVVRTVEQCALVLHDLMGNRLQTKLEADEHNYKLIESRTGSTIRVIPKHRLIRNAFATYYAKQHQPHTEQD